MRSAKETYELLIKTAEATPYNQEVIDKLEKFDYVSFAQANDLNGIIFKEVEQRLGTGDITGCYKNAYAGIYNIEKLLVSMQYEATLSIIPRLPVLWKLNGLCSDTLIFCQYVAMVFHKI